jgi:hypothetical protein
LVGSVLLLVAGCGSSGRPQLFRTHGIVIRAPTGWHVSTRPLNNVTDPVQRFVLSSARLPKNANSSAGYVPPSHAVLAQLVEEVPPDFSNPWPKRPARFKRPHLNGMETFAGNRWGELLFSDRGRHFYIFVWVGREATSTEVAALMRALDGLEVKAPHVSAATHPTCRARTGTGAYETTLRPSSGAVGSTVTVSGHLPVKRENGTYGGQTATEVEVYWNLNFDRWWSVLGTSPSPMSSVAGSPVKLLGTQDVSKLCIYQVQVRIPPVSPGTYPIEVLNQAPGHEAPGGGGTSFATFAPTDFQVTGG